MCGNDFSSISNSEKMVLDTLLTSSTRIVSFLFISLLLSLSFVSSLPPPSLAYLHTCAVYFFLIYSLLSILFIALFKSFMLISIMIRYFGNFEILISFPGGCGLKCFFNFFLHKWKIKCVGKQVFRFYFIKQKINTK